MDLNLRSEFTLWLPWAGYSSPLRLSVLLCKMGPHQALLMRLQTVDLDEMGGQRLLRLCSEKRTRNGEKLGSKAKEA